MASVINSITNIYSFTETSSLPSRYEALRTAMAQEINQRQGVVQQPRQMLPQYPTATLTELPADSADPSAATAAVEEETVEGEDFLTPSDYVGGENYLANVAQVR